jgi:hypothetical protein
LLHAKGTLRVNHRNEANDASVTTDPAPGEGRESHALTVDVVNVTADVFETNDVVTQ